MTMLPNHSLQSGEIGSFLSYGGDTSSMKVFSRKKNESLCIGSDITIMVVEIRGDKVRLGIEYPKEIIVQRKEVSPNEIVTIGVSGTRLAILSRCLPM